MFSSSVVTTLAVVFVLSRIVKYHSDKKKVLGLPGLRCLIHPVSPIGALVPHFFLNPGLSWSWYWRNQVYEPVGAKTISIVAWLLGDPLIFTTSMEVARQLVTTRGQFEKSAETTAILAQWGPNLFSTNGDDWRRHRRILGAAFNADVYRFVWKETASLFEEMVDVEQWNAKRVVTLTPVNRITTKFALNIISRCAFGNVLPWQSDVEAGGVDFAEALEIVARSYLLRVIIPKWMYKLPIAYLRRMDAAYKTLGSFMTSVLASRKAEVSGKSVESQSRHDLFSFMTSASDEDGQAALTDDEVISNTFLMLFAGHDTTAHTLDATIGFLALYQDIQNELYDEIKAVALDDMSLPYDAYTKLVKAEACFLEALRLFPAAFMMLRRATEDVVITTGDPHIHGGRLAVPKGTNLVVDLVGMHYNAEYFPNPEEYRPSRWYGARENDLSMFSFGSRACIGRRFALTEAVGFISHLLLKWRIEPIFKDRETPAQWRKRVMVADMAMTLGVSNIPVRLVARA